MPIEREPSPVTLIKQELLEGTIPRSTKKRRVLMDAVVVPTLASILRKKKVASQQYSQAEKEQLVKNLENVRPATGHHCHADFF